ncbi:uncharacterized protein PODANS_1_6630 [Podospora anserina S mat+]|uniref:Podospora anserina S mat+ genomic DNA chromosome 1, supercontig 1 n=1 Tax=Podospora anserina (strain S / ATCC MYA-4624 / DSM 980 / FGSC 10383) TaxID=515849 RepID=B2ABA1_PODAN|nr:uncharacterized protein PODANS_1_6630 [Podospora anserina S mat+]CAP60363.1 unnamed protein product [Podospora anserina S mat+]CDP23002.1 Putative protein of unknown function [Podospora anserina S mat+]
MRRHRKGVHPPNREHHRQQPHHRRAARCAAGLGGQSDYRDRTLPVQGASWKKNRYLSCDKIGLFSATSEAITPLESFSVIPTADTPGTFQIQTLRDTFLSVRASRSSKANASPEVRGDETEITFDTTLRIRMQARYKPKLKASKEEKAREKISRAELEAAVGRRLDEDEVKRLKRARREGDYHEAVLDLKVKGKHDKYG